MDEESFESEWLEARGEQELKEVLLRNDHSITVRVSDNEARDWINQQLKDLDLPGSCLVALVQRDGDVEFPHGSTEFRDGDRITIIGEPGDIKALRARLKSS